MDYGTGIAVKSLGYSHPYLIQKLKEQSEKLWHLSKEYQNQPGGHLRVFNQSDLVTEIKESGFKFLASEKFHSIHSPYWWLRCFFWNSQESNIFVKLYKRILERHILKKPIKLLFKYALGLVKEYRTPA